MHHIFWLISLRHYVTNIVKLDQNGNVIIALIY